MIPDLRWLGLASILVIILASAIPLLGKPLDWQDSVSHSWVGSRRKWLTLATLLTIGGTGLCVSLALWAVPHYDLPVLLYGIIALAYAGMLAVAWVPMTDRPGEHSMLHGHFLGGSALATLAIIALASVIWFGTDVRSATRIASFIALLFAASWPLLFISPARRIFLALESLIAMSFLAALVLLFVT